MKNDFCCLNGQEKQKYVADRVRRYYWEEDVNCATTMLNTLGEIHCLELAPQLIGAAGGMHGAGGYGAQCGLVEGTLLFIGAFCREKGQSKEIAANHCYRFASAFEKDFGSLRCCDLRPRGFQPDDPPHLCEGLTNKAVLFAAEFIRASEIGAL